MRRMRRLAGAVVAAAVLGLGIAACGDDDSGGTSGTIIRGTTDQPVAYDPAGAYDLPSYDVIYNVYQNLLTYPPGETKPQPEAAESCEFTDDVTFECTMRDGLKFSDGSPLTAEDVVFSFERNVEIADPNGASSLLANMKSIEAPDDKTVVFNLKEPDATWPAVITTASFAIVPSDTYPADKLQDSAEVIGSGRYQVAEYEPGQQTVLQVNDEYTGDDPPKTDQAIIQYFDKASALKLALEQGDVDIAYRSLSPTDIEDLRGAEGVEVVAGEGAEIRYLVFNLKLQDGTDEQKQAVRQAVAQTIDRQSIVDNVYGGTVKPLYSMIPASLDYSTEAFADAYGEAPDLEGAEQTLADAGVKTPVPLEVWWTPSHYGAASGDEYAEIKRQLDESGLFDVTLKSTEWNQYSTSAFTDKYPQYQLGWFPDYPDPDDYAASFYAPTSFLNIHYDNPEMNKLLAEEKAATDPAVREKAFARIQEIGAEEVPTIPIWEGDQVAGAREGVEGLAETFDPAFIFRFWLLSKES
ncbi:MAG: ABC transporter substrate-binding protein [Solirubrobacterales bacterium]|nr:ABC transporter substrate-binding protein [Solirubrobacterales bacterium]